ncbi:MAG TPA: TIGR03118 family protein [Gemmataceae bacterium]|nr:TIGR03118 family protein [Gemmataceae bacterium]
MEERCVLTGSYTQVNLASDVPGLARLTDPALVNPWGVSFSPTGPFWFADNGTGVSDLLDGRGEPVPLLVRVPGASRSRGTPTGTVFDGGRGFVVSRNGVSAPARFLFATEDGTISGWTAVVDPRRALLAVDNSSAGAVYKGLALAADPAGDRFLYAADFGRGEIDVFDQDFRPVVRPGAFRDPDLPHGFAPFNIQNIGNLLYVTYALRDANGKDDLPGPGHGFIDVFDTRGELVRRFASRGPLDSPWGLAVAPAGFGPFSGALLVGNTGDGRINAYDRKTGDFLGPLTNDEAAPITIPTLWALTFGNGHEGGDSHTLFFTAGVDYEEHGLFGAIQPPQRKGADTAGLGSFDPHSPGEPGDYPLPPRGGPTLQNQDDGRSPATPALLPLKDSPVALAPTLSVVAQPRPRLDAPATPVVALPLGKSVGTPPAGPDAALVTPAASDPPPPEYRQNAPLTLDTLVTLNGTLAGPGNPVAGQQLEANREARSVAEPVPASAPASGQTDVGLGPSECRPRPAEDGGSGTEGIEARHHGRWKEFARSILVVLGLPVIYTLCRPRPARSSCPASVKVTLDVSADFPTGDSEQTKRAVSENANSLGFKTTAWE